MKPVEKVVMELTEEKRELDQKIERLRGFVTSESDAWHSLSDNHQTLLLAQHDTMRSYSNILKLRLTDLMDSVEYNT